MEKAVQRIASVFGVLATLATLVMMVSIAFDVVFRLLYDRSMPGVLEISETSLVTAVFLGLAYTGSTNSLISVDLLTERLPAHVARWVIAVAWILSTVFLAWMLAATTARALAATAEGEVRMGLVSWPLWPSRWIIVIGLAAMLLVALVNVWRTTVRGVEVLGAHSPEHLVDAPTHPYELVIGDEEEDEK